MKRVANAPRIRNVVRHTATVVAIALFLAAGICAVSYERDCRALRALAHDLSAGAQTPSETVFNLMDWVYQDLGTRRNEGYFLFSSLGPTPVQVMRGGGDCADKSRLLCALLQEVGMSATPAMSFDPKTGVPVHTIVQAEPVKGQRMIVDPSYNLFFPQADGSGYHDLLDLRRDPAIVQRRVDQLFRNSSTRREADKYYLASLAGYHGVSTINWGKRPAYAAVRDILYGWMGEEVYSVRRPFLLERPKLIVSMGFLLGGFLLLTSKCLRHLGQSRKTKTLAREVYAASVEAANAGTATTAIRKTAVVHEIPARSGALSHTGTSWTSATDPGAQRDQSNSAPESVRTTGGPR